MGTSLLASIQTDFFDELKEGLAKMLLKPNQLAPRIISNDEFAFRQLRLSLPEKVFAMYLSSHPDQLNKYTQILQERAYADVKEEKDLIAAIRTKDFRFCQKIAIDAFPNIHSEAP